MATGSSKEDSTEWSWNSSAFLFFSHFFFKFNNYAAKKRLLLVLWRLCTCVIVVLWRIYYLGSFKRLYCWLRKLYFVLSHFCNKKTLHLTFCTMLFLKSGKVIDFKNLVTVSTVFTDGPVGFLGSQVKIHWLHAKFSRLMFWEIFLGHLSH